MTKKFHFFMYINWSDFKGWEVERSLTLKMTIGAAACVDWHVGQALPIHIGFPKLRLPCRVEKRYLSESFCEVHRSL
jgi:hypothetical protein